MYAAIPLKELLGIGQLTAVRRLDGATKYRIAHPVREFNEGLYLRYSAQDEGCHRKRQGLLCFQRQQRIRNLWGGHRYS